MTRFFKEIQQENKGRYVMKFLLIVLAIHFIGELISRGIKKGREEKSVKNGEMPRHPAEYDIR